jgi:hypothetical protein
MKVPYIHHTLKASIVTLFFLLAGILSLSAKTNYAYIVPISLFYLMLTINTYFSIRLFVQITSKDDWVQNGIDLVLVALYILAALSMDNVLHFMFYILLLFIVATAKYTHLLNKTPHRMLLKNKILTDTSGILGCALTLGGIIFWHPGASIWIFSFAFIFANFALFFVWPLYRLDAI